MHRPDFKAAYEFEAQALVIARAQLDHRLQIGLMIFGGYELRKEAGHKWYIIEKGPAAIYSGDVNERILRSLTQGERLCQITAIAPRPDLFGQPTAHPLALLSRGTDIIYSSPGFDLDRHKRNKLFPFQE